MGGDGGEDGGDDSAEGGGRVAEHGGRITADDGAYDSAEDRGRAVEARGRKSVEDGPNVSIHVEFYIEYGSSFATATDAIPSTSATHNYCESLDTLYRRLNTLT